MLEIKWYGTATISFSEDDRSILFDPFLPMNPDHRLFTAGELASVGDILITHGHFDHLADVPQIVGMGGPQV